MVHTLVVLCVCVCVYIYISIAKWDSYVVITVDRYLLPIASRMYM